jgi:hypothetical protein
MDLSSSEALPSLLLNDMDYAWPNLREWERIVQSSTCIGKESEGFPLVIARRSALYLRKYSLLTLLSKKRPPILFTPRKAYPPKNRNHLTRKTFNRSQ